MTRQSINLTTDYLKGFIDEGEWGAISSEIEKAHQQLVSRSGPGSDFLGWLDLSSYIQKEGLRRIEDLALQVKSECDVLLSLGIGGSYLGARAAIEFTVKASREDRGIPVYFAGFNLSSDYLSALLRQIKGREVGVCVISKSGTTTETALAFRIVKEFLEKRFAKRKLQRRIVCITDSAKGALREMAQTYGYPTLDIPSSVGGRFSVLTAAGLFPISVAGVDIRKMVEGARDLEEALRTRPLYHPAYRYAALRNILYRKGKSIELLSFFHPRLFYLAQWWRQLFGESEGKLHRGIFPDMLEYTTDLHSMGQLVQEGPRNLFETFLIVERSLESMMIPAFPADTDGFNCVAGKDLELVNQKAYLATAQAHFQGGVPNITLSIPECTPYWLGQLFYFFQRAVAVSGYVLGVNPFNQPGVEAYKKEMFRLLGKG
jgi:glucose-6-phosphate isomerase